MDRRRAPTSFAAALSLFVVACSGDVDRAPTPLVGGTLESGAPEVVAIIDLARSGLCTGTFVSPHVVLTAKHCVQAPLASEPAAPDNFRVLEGSAIEAPARTLDVVRVATTPGAYDITSAGGTSGALIGVDVAVITTAEAASATRAFRRDRVRGLVGMTLTAYGFGGTPEGDNGHKYVAPVRVDSMTSQVILSGPTVCHGDSGGPLVHPDGDVVGVASLGPAECGTGPGVHNTLQSFADMIDEAIVLAGDSEPDFPDAGAPGDAGAATDAGPGTDGGPSADAGATHDASSADAGRPKLGGGGGCTTTNGQPSGLPVVSIVVLAALVARRRARER
jgi:V8-like Glu-specific endopeptidase